MTEVFQQLSAALAAAVEAVSPSIVRVEARRRFPATGIVWARDGIIVTAHHVIERDDTIRLGLHGGETITATLVGRDPTADLAVLRATTQGLVPPTWAELAGISQPPFPRPSPQGIPDGPTLSHPAWHVQTARRRAPPCCGPLQRGRRRGALARGRRKKCFKLPIRPSCRAIPAHMVHRVWEAYHGVG